MEKKVTMNIRNDRFNVKWFCFGNENVNPLLLEEPNREVVQSLEDGDYFDSHDLDPRAVHST
jgi:hypothetical protein